MRHLRRSMSSATDFCSFLRAVRMPTARFRRDACPVRGRARGRQRADARLRVLHPQLVRVLQRGPAPRLRAALQSNHPSLPNCTVHTDSQSSSSPPCVLRSRRRPARALLRHCCGSERALLPPTPHPSPGAPPLGPATPQAPFLQPKWSRPRTAPWRRRRRREAPGRRTRGATRDR